MMDIEVVAEGLLFPEGPIALADGSVIITEIAGGRLTKVMQNGDKFVVAETGGGPNGAALGPDGAIYVTNNGGMNFIERNGLLLSETLLPDSNLGGTIQRVDIASGQVTTLYRSTEGVKLIAPNDLVFDRSGNFWFTDHGCATPDGRRYGAVYYAKADGSSISRVCKHLLSPNGIALSPDESTLYVADTILARLWAFDLKEPGALSSPQSFAPGRVVCNLQGFQGLDSMAVEENGNVCVGTLYNGGITTFGLAGSVDHTPFPDLGTTNICFGGADMQTAWVTGSSTGRLFRCHWPRPGLVTNYSA